MPGPSIANAVVTVDLDGRRIPAEAAVLGREAGAAMGRAHSDAYKGEVEQGLSDVGRDLARQMKVDGDNQGHLFGRSFSDAMKSDIQARAGTLQRDLASIFTDAHGFDDFNRSLNGTEQKIGDVDRALGGLATKMDELHRLGGIDDELYNRNAEGLLNWAEAASQTEKENAGLRQSLFDLRENGLRQVLDDLANAKRDTEVFTQSLRDLREKGLNEALDGLANAKRDTEVFTQALRDLREEGLNRTLDRLAQFKLGSELAAEALVPFHDEAIRINKALDTATLRNYAADLGRTAKPANDLQKEMGNLLIHLRDVQSAFTVGALGSEDMVREFDRLTPRVHVLGDAMHLSERAIRDVVSGAEDVGTVFGKVGKDGETLGAKVGLLTKGFSGLKGVLSQMSSGLTGGGGLLGIVGIVALVVAALGPLSVLLAATAGGATILGAAAFGAVGGLVAFYGIFKQITSLDAAGLKVLPAQMRATAVAFQDLIGVANPKTGKLQVGKLFTDLQTGLSDAFLRTKGLDSVLRTFTNTTLPEIGSAIAPVGSAMGGLFKQILAGLSSKNALSDIKGLVGEIADALPRLGTLAGTSFGIIDQLLIDAKPFMDKFLDDTNKVLGSFLDFLKSPAGHDAVTGWLDNAVIILGNVRDAIGQAVGGIAKLAADPEQVNNTVSALVAIGDSVPHLVALGDTLGPLVPVIFQVVDEFSQMAAAFALILTPIFLVIGGLQEMHEAFLIQLNAISNGIIHFVQSAGAIFGDLGAILRDVANNDVGRLGRDLNKLTTDTGAAVAQLGSDIASGFGNMSSIFDNLDATSKHTLNGLTSDLGITGAAAKDAGGVIVTAAAAAGVSLSDLAGTTTINELISKLHLVGPAADDLRTAIIDDAAKSGTAFKLLDASSQSSLGSLATKLHLTGTTSDLFKEKITEMTHGNITKLAELAQDTSLRQVEATLGLTGAKAKEFEALFGSSMSGAASSSDSAKGHVIKFQQTVGELKNKQVIISELGAAAAATQVEALASQLRALHDRQVTITAVSNISPQLGRLAQLGVLGAHGGIMAGGQMLAGGEVAFANGGILTSATRFGNVIAGEAGAEAIVPLTGPIDKVDASVRQLAAFARGMSDGFGGETKVVYVQPTIVVPTADPETVAGYVVDRLVPQI